MNENGLLCKTIEKLLDEAENLTQAQLADRISFTPSRLSRLLSGETDLSDQDAELIARGIGTEDAIAFADYLKQVWQITPKPAFAHPGRVSLWKAEQALQNLAALAKNPNLKNAFVEQIESVRSALDRAAVTIRSTEHPVALIGPPAVGKTTLTCTGGGLRKINEEEDDLNHQMALQTGGGRVTISEVHVRNSAEYTITMDPCSVDEVSQFVSEFCDDLLRKEDPTDEGTPEEFRIPAEVERAIRNMAKLPPAKRGKTADGQKFHRPDAARELAKSFPDKQDLLVQVLTRMELTKRTRTSITYPRGESTSGLDWVAKVCGQINYGHHADFSIPRRIEITVPTRVLGAKDLDIRLIDTRGVDEPSAPRRDLQAFLDDERCLIVLCSKFDDAPHAATLAVIDRAIGSGLRNAIIDRGIMLVLPRDNEDMAQRDGSTGEWVSSSEEGREIKLDHVSSTLAHHGCQKLQVLFVNVRSEEDCEEMRKTIVARIREIRRKTENQIDDLCTVIRQLIDAQTEEARNTFVAATKAIRDWIVANTQLPKLQFDVHANLIKEMKGLRWASSLRASVNRRGNWHNFDYWHGLGFGARSETVSRCEQRIEELKKLIKDALDNPAYASVKGFLGHFLTEIEKSVAEFYQWSQSLGESAFKAQLGDDAVYWAQCRDRWGGGSGYRDAIKERTERWFSEKDRQERESFIESEIQARWAETMAKMNQALTSGDGK